MTNRKLERLREEHAWLSVEFVNEMEREAEEQVRRDQRQGATAELDRLATELFLDPMQDLARDVLRAFGPTAGEWLSRWETARRTYALASEELLDRAGLLGSRFEADRLADSHPLRSLVPLFETLAIVARVTEERPDAAP